MKIIRSFILCLLPFIFAGCDVSSLGDMNKAVENGRTEIEIVKEFDEGFPGAYHFISYYSGRVGTPRWNSQIGIYGRYVLSVQFDLEFDAARIHPRRISEPKFYFTEIAEIDSKGISYEQSFKFSMDDWNKLRDSKWDFTSLGYDLKKDQPLPGFDDNWHSASLEIRKKSAIAIRSWQASRKPKELVASLQSGFWSWL